MADTILTTDLSAMHDAIVAGIQAQFPTLQTVEFYREDRTSIALPACILELDEMPSAHHQDPGNGQIALEARYCAHLLVGFTTPNCRLQIRLLAAAMAGFLHQIHWTGITSDAGEVHGCYENDFTPLAKSRPQLDQFECWKVEWSHVVFIGEDAWAAIAPDVIPTVASTLAEVNGVPDVVTPLAGYP